MPIFSDDTGPSVRPFRGGRPVMTLSAPLSIVIVDDYDINLTLFKALVSRIPGLEPRCFKVSAQGLAWCEENGADLVIVDYMMPAPDGIGFIRRFRKIPGMLDVPVVMVTANTLTTVRNDALQAGATDFLTKPIDKDEFIARITNMAALRRGQRLLADRAALLAKEVEAATATIVERELDTIVRLTKAAEYRDQETGAHIERMAHYSLLIAAAMGSRKESSRLSSKPHRCMTSARSVRPTTSCSSPGSLPTTR